MSDLEYKKFVRKPFFVEVVEVTLENIEEIATMVGQLRHKDGKPFIQVNRNVVPGVNRVFPGYFMTRMDDNIRCYNKKVFADQFIANQPDIEEWVEYINQPPAEPKPEGEPEVGPFGRIIVTDAEVEEVPQPEPVVADG